MGTQNWGISNLCSSRYKLGNPDSADKRGPLSAKEKKRKEKEKEKENVTGARFRLFIKPDSRDPRSATLVHVSRDQTKQESHLNSASKRQRDPSARLEADASQVNRPRTKERREEGRKRGRERNLLSSIPLGSSKNGLSRRRWNDQFEI